MALLNEQESQKINFKKGKAVVYYADMHLSIPEIAGRVKLSEAEIEQVLSLAGLFPKPNWQQADIPQQQMGRTPFLRQSTMQVF